MANTIHIAQGPGDESYTVPQLFAGDTPAVTTRDALVKSTQGAIPQYTPLSWDNTNGIYIAWVAGQEISAVTAYAIPDLAVDQRVALYFGGCFNVDAIAWPEGTSEADVESSMNASGANSLLVFRKPLWSDKRVLAGGLAVGPGHQVPPEDVDA